MRKSSKIYGLKLKKPLQPESRKIRIFVEDSDLKIDGKREFVDLQNFANIITKFIINKRTDG